MTHNPDRIARAAGEFGKRRPQRRKLEDDSCLDRPVSAASMLSLECRMATVRRWLEYGIAHGRPVSDAYCTGHGGLTVEQVTKIREELK